MEKKDERMKVSTEILNGIKYIKMSGWEEAFLKKVIKFHEFSSPHSFQVLVARNGELSWLTP